MKWNEIKKHFAQVDTAKQSGVPLEKITPQGTTVPTNMNRSPKTSMVVRWLFLIVILIIIALGVITIIQVIKNHKQSRAAVSAISREDFQTINTFLDQNPPKPLTTDENKTVNSVLDKEVTLDTNDIQSINNVLNNVQ